MWPKLKFHQLEHTTNATRDFHPEFPTTPLSPAPIPIRIPARLLRKVQQPGSPRAGESFVFRRAGVAMAKTHATWLWSESQARNRCQVDPKDPKDPEEMAAAPYPAIVN